MIASVATPADALSVVVEILADVVIVIVAIAVGAAAVISVPTTPSPFVIVVGIDFDFNRTEAFQWRKSNIGSRHS